MHRTEWVNMRDLVPLLSVSGLSTPNITNNICDHKLLILLQTRYDQSGTVWDIAVYVAVNQEEKWFTQILSCYVEQVPFDEIQQ